MPLLDIRNLTIEFKAGDEWVKAVDRVSMTLAEGRSVGWWANRVPVKASSPKRFAA